MKTVDVSAPFGARNAWNTQLQRGFEMEARDGMTMRSFLADVMGYDDRCIEEAVRTVFLNSSPVDDIDAAVVRGGDRVALGSAMPGLVGVCMGRDNPYKSFREGIACTGQGAPEDAGLRVSVFVKVFSTLAVDTGEALLGCGVRINGGELLALLEATDSAATHSGRPLDVTSMDPEEIVLVRVAFTQ